MKHPLQQHIYLKIVLKYQKINWIFKMMSIAQLKLIVKMKWFKKLEIRESWWRKTSFKEVL